LSGAIAGKRTAHPLTPSQAGACSQQIRNATLIRLPRFSPALSPATAVMQKSGTIERRGKEDSVDSDGRSGPVAAAGETHSTERQKLLRLRAEQIGAELSECPEVQLVWLTGSVAKGLVDASSDLDIHVFVSGPKLELSPWRFTLGSAPENIHQFDVETLREGLAARGNQDKLARWMATTCLADALHDASCLYCKPEARHLQAGVEELLTLRRQQPYRAAIAQTFARFSAEITSEAEEVLREGAALDAHQILRRATQELLLAHLISRDWILRGSKKRPEIAVTYGLGQSEPEFMRLFYAVNGLSALSHELACQLCEERHEFRKKFASHLRDLAGQGGGRSASAESVISDYERHNLDAENYYSSLLDAGLYCGPVNHIRAFSGFMKVPAIALNVVGRETRFPAAEWAGNPQRGSGDIIGSWLRISDLSPSPSSVSEMIAAIGLEAAAFNRP
jgi:hypothetical protein